MKSVNCYKGISNRLLVFGIQPVDNVLLLVGFLFVHGIFNSLLIDFVYILLGYIFAKKTRNRPSKVLLHLYLYFITPPILTLERNEHKNESVNTNVA